MPLTLSHTVAVIPLAKPYAKYLALSPLLIGSMTPDVAYLTPYLVHQRVDSHSLLGVYLFCIPMGLTLYFLYHLLMAPVVVSLLPGSIKQHLSKDLFVGKLPSIPSHVLVLSLVIGALTHVIWDFFTHQSGIPQHIQWMDTPLMRIDSYDIMPYRVLQHLSSIFGLVLLLVWIRNWYKRKNVNSKTINQNHWKASKQLKTLALIIIIGCSAVAGIFNGYTKLPNTDVLYGLYSAQVFIRFAIVGGFAGLLLSCIGVGLLYRYQIKQTAFN